MSLFEQVKGDEPAIDNQLRLRKEHIELPKDNDSLYDFLDPEEIAISTDDYFSACGYDPSKIGESIKGIRL